MSIKDRTNVKYGMLTAIKYIGKSKWLCRCYCGNEKIVYGGHLESGHTKSCGCVRPPRLNLIGEKYGKLTVLEWKYNGQWLCKCECGNEVTVATYNLRNGNTQSCGCLQKEKVSQAIFKDIIGLRFGKLIVVERVENNRYNHTCYKCLCDCGGEIITESGRLRKGKVNSCGCLKSVGEMKIQQYLQENKINYIAQYSHDKIFLSSGRRPFFDFAIFDNENNLLCFIEYQGKQHYEYSDNGWDNKENYQATKRRDNERRVQCAKLNIPLYEIPYWELDNIDEVLTDIIKNMEEAQEIEVN